MSSVYYLKSLFFLGKIAFALQVIEHINSWRSMSQGVFRLSENANAFDLLGNLLNTNVFCNDFILQSFNDSGICPLFGTLYPR